MPTIPNDIVLASYLTGIYDVNRNEVLAHDDYSKIASWATSLAAQGLTGVVFHNSLSEKTCRLHTNQYLHFVKVQADNKYNPNVYRYFLYKSFLQANNIDNVFITDITDVVALQNPFIQEIFIRNTQAIFCGDEPKKLDNDWMNSHSEHLRNQINGYAAYEEKYKDAMLLNCGIVGGSYTIMKLFIEKICNIHSQFNADNKTAYTGDMGAFNYLLRTQFDEHIIHGYPVNTVFKAYENERADCWFRHK